MSLIYSSNMSLPIPAIGTESGPAYATDINNCLSIVDQHSHIAGSGVQITPAAININSSLAFNSQFAVSLAGATFSAQLSTPSNNTVYESGVDLYFVDGNGNNVRITQSGGVAGSPGSISNLNSPATATYVAGSQTFVWQSDVSTPANLDAASVLLRNLVASSKSLTLSPPNAMANNFTLTLPLIPAAQSFLTIDTSGNFGTAVPYSLGITTGNIADAAITTAKIADASVTSAKLDPTIVFFPSGAIVAFGGAAAPSGYLLCDGSSVLRATYANLFTAIGTAYGAADGTHFNLPDLRGLFPRGVSGASGNDPDASSRTAQHTGGATGNNVGSVQADNFASHIHHSASNGGGSIAPFQTVNISNGVSSQSWNIPTDATGGNETRPKNLYVNYIIKT